MCIGPHKYATFAHISVCVSLEIQSLVSSDYTKWFKRPQVLVQVN